MRHKHGAGLFATDPAMVCRDRMGRFATPERAYADKAISENRLLRIECEKYRRSYLAAADLAGHWQRKYLELQEKVKAICK